MKKVDRRCWVLFASIMGIIIVVGSILYVQQPVFKLRQYMSAINHKNFEKAYELLFKDEVINDHKKQEIIQYMERYFTQEQFIKLELSSLERKNYLHEASNIPRVYFEVKYIFENNVLQNGISLVKEENGWRIIFPFKLTDVTVYAPIGAEVYFDGQKIAKKNDGDYYVEHVLPGKHTVKINFFDQIYGAYVTNINVPEQKEVIVPYETVQVSVDTPKNMIVELAGEKKINAEGKITFDNVLEGTYTLRVTDPYGHLKNWSRTIEVSGESKQFDVEELNFSETGKEKIEDYIHKFYKTYGTGITKQDVTFLNEYVVEKQREDVKDLFDNWFIKNKNIKEASIVYEIEEIQPEKDGLFSVEVLEEIDITNKEKGYNETKIDRHYKIIIRSSILLEAVGESYIINDKTINESIVSYKDEFGKWIAY